LYLCQINFLLNTRMFKVKSWQRIQFFFIFFLVFTVNAADGVGRNKIINNSLTGLFFETKESSPINNLVVDLDLSVFLSEYSVDRSGPKYNCLKSLVGSVVVRAIFDEEKKKLFINRVNDVNYGIELIALLFLLILTLLGFSIYFCVRERRCLKVIERCNVELKSLHARAEKSLKAKEVLLGEVHHRVKNNLQMVVSLLNIEARQNKMISVQDFVEKAEGRIEVFALIHGNLSEIENEGKIVLNEYVGNLLSNIFDLYTDEKIVVNLNASGILLDTRTATSIGLIINELVCNSVKHAFTDEVEGVITIRIKNTDGCDYKLFYGDNGLGCKSIGEKKKSLGLKLVDMIVAQMDGEVLYVDSPGCNYEINFRDVTESTKKNKNYET
jgi:two-component sensor histidine kinase